MKQFDLLKPKFINFTPSQQEEVMNVIFENVPNDKLREYEYMKIIRYLSFNKFKFKIPIETKSGALNNYFNKIKFDLISNTHNDITKTLPPEIVHSEIAKYFGGSLKRKLKSFKKKII